VFSVQCVCRFCEDLQRVVGFDWLLVSLQSHVHQSTVVLAMSILVRMLQQPSLLQCFREGSGTGGWLADTECIVQNRVGVLLGRLLYCLISIQCSIISCKVLSNFSGTESCDVAPCGPVYIQATRCTRQTNPALIFIVF